MVAVQQRAIVDFKIADDADIQWPLNLQNQPEIDPAYRDLYDWDRIQPDIFQQSTTTITQNIIWTFNYTGGTRLAVYGITLPWILGVAPSATYHVDGGSGVTLSPPNATEMTANVAFFVMDPVRPHEGTNNHTLTVDLQASPQAPYILDYIVFKSPNDEEPNDSITGSSTTSRLATRSAGGSGMTGTPTSSSVSLPPDRPNTATIAGGAVGGTLLLLALAGVYMWWRRRRRLEGMPIRSARDSALLDSTPTSPTTAGGFGGVSTPRMTTLSVPPTLVSRISHVESVSGASSAPTQSFMGGGNEKGGVFRLEPPPSSAGPSSSGVGGSIGDVLSGQDVNSDSPPAYGS